MNVNVEILAKNLHFKVVLHFHFYTFLLRIGSRFLLEVKLNVITHC